MEMAPMNVAADLARLEEIGQELEAVEATLRRLEETSYGTCELCGARIADDELAADPLATRCFAHAS